MIVGLRDHRRLLSRASVGKCQENEWHREQDSFHGTEFPGWRVVGEAACRRDRLSMTRIGPFV